MIEIGYALSSEEHGPRELVDLAGRAEETGFTFALISDHYHPWTDTQGHSPFVWSIIGGIAATTKRLKLGTGVTCPTIRIHPAVIAQAAATSQLLMDGRFFLGVGTGENLNEHILGDRWPEFEVRLEMLEEALEVMRLLWDGGNKSHHGKHYRVENARVYDLPEQPVPVYVAASGPTAASLAGRVGDGFIGVAPESQVVEKFRGSGGNDKARLGQLTVCWAETEAEAKGTAHRVWPNAAIKGQLGQELPQPAHFEQAAEMVTADDVADVIICGPDPEKHLEGIRKFVDAGYDHVYIHQVGPDQEGFFDFYRKSVLPKIG